MLPVSLGLLGYNGAIEAYEPKLGPKERQMAESFNGSNGWRTDPLYTVPEAARMAHVSASTVRNWLYGRKGQEQLFKAAPTPMVSFLHLIEIVIAANFRKAEKVSFGRVRRAYVNAQEILQLEYPFAYAEFKAIGGHIVHAMHEETPEPMYQAMDEPTQWTLPGLVSITVSQIRYERKLAAQWYPVGDRAPIVVDPRITSGVPTISGRGVTVRIIRKRFMAGQDIDFIARDFELENSVVEQAIRYGELVAA